MIQKPDTLKRDITFTIDGIEYFAEEGVIEETHLGVEDHGIFTFNLAFSFPGSGQSFGNLALDTYSSEVEKRIGTAFGMQAIIDVIHVVTGEYGSWEKLQGRRVYALRAKEYGYIDGIASLDGERVWLPQLAVREWQNTFDTPVSFG